MMPSKCRCMNIYHGNHLMCAIQGALHDNFPGFLGFGFCTKLACTKTKKAQKKRGKHNGRTVFTSIRYLLIAHQQK